MLQVPEPGFYTVEFEAHGYRRKTLRDVDARRGVSLDVVKLERRADEAGIDLKALERRIEEIVREQLASADWTNLVPAPQIEIKPGIFGSTKVTGLGAGTSTANAQEPTRHVDDAQGKKQQQMESASAQEPEDDGWQTIDVWSKTPLGKKTGKLRIKVQDGKVEGALTMLGSTSELQNGIIDEEGNFEWDGTLNTPIGLIEAHTTGTLKGGILEAQSVSKMGTFELHTKQ